MRVTASVGQQDRARARRLAGATTVVAKSFTLARSALFASESARISAADARYLADVRASLRGVRTVTCLGYTDSRGSWESGVALGRRRAQAVCALLVKGTGARARVVAMGEKSPRATNTTAAGRALNRRTDVRLDY